MTVTPIEPFLWIHYSLRSSTEVRFFNNATENNRLQLVTIYNRLQLVTIYLNFSDLGTHFLNIAYLVCEYFGPLVAVLPTILSKQSYCCRYFAFRPAQAASITFEHTADACDGCQQCQVTLQGLLRSTILAIAYSMSQVLPLALAAWRA